MQLSEIFADIIQIFY